MEMGTIEKELEKMGSHGVRKKNWQFFYHCAGKIERKK